MNKLIYIIILYYSTSVFFIISCPLHAVTNNNKISFDTQIKFHKVVHDPEIK